MFILICNRLQVNKFNSSENNEISSFKQENGKAEKHSEPVFGEMCVEWGAGDFDI